MLLHGHAGSWPCGSESIRPQDGGAFFLRRHSFTACDGAGMSPTPDGLFRLRQNRTSRNKHLYGDEKSVAVDEARGLGAADLGHVGDGAAEGGAVGYLDLERNRDRGSG